MADLTTRWMGLALQSPVIVEAGPLSQDQGGHARGRPRRCRGHRHAFAVRGATGRGTDGRASEGRCAGRPRCRSRRLPARRGVFDGWRRLACRACGVEGGVSVPVAAMECVVGCSTCGKLCPTGAISFPPLAMVWKVEREHQMFRSQKEEALARREREDARKMRAAVAAASAAAAAVLSRAAVEVAGELGDKRFLARQAGEGAVAGAGFQDQVGPVWTRHARAVGAMGGSRGGCAGCGGASPVRWRPRARMPCTSRKSGPDRRARP